MFETGTTKSIKEIFKKILNGSENHEKFMDLLSKYYQSATDVKYNAKQVLEMLRTLKKYLRDGISKALEDGTKLIGIKTFIKLHDIDLFDKKMYLKLEEALFESATYFAEQLAKEIDIVLVENNKMRDPMAISDTKTISPKELNRIVMNVFHRFKSKIQESFIDEIKKNDDKIEQNIDTKELVNN